MLYGRDFDDHEIDDDFDEEAAREKYLSRKHGKEDGDDDATRQ